MQEEQPIGDLKEEVLRSTEWTTTFSEEEIDEDLASFQEDEMVQQALQRGVDLKKYGRELENDLRQASLFAFIR